MPLVATIKWINLCVSASHRWYLLDLALEDIHKMVVDQEEGEYQADDISFDYFTNNI